MKTVLLHLCAFAVVVVLLCVLNEVFRGDDRNVKLLMELTTVGISLLVGAILLFTYGRSLKNRHLSVPRILLQMSLLGFSFFIIYCVLGFIYVIEWGIDSL